MSQYMHQDAKLWQRVKIGRSVYYAIGRRPDGVMLWKGASGPTIYVLVEKAQGEFGFGRFDDKPFAQPISQQFSQMSTEIKRYVRAQQKAGVASYPKIVGRPDPVAWDDLTETERAEIRRQYEGRGFSIPDMRNFKVRWIKRYGLWEYRDARDTRSNPGGSVRKNVFAFNNPGPQQRILAENFVKGANSGVAGNLYIHGARIYSYGPHFPIAERYTVTMKGPGYTASGAPVIIITNRKSPSKTTSAQIGLVKAAAQQAGLEIMYQDLAPEAKGPAAYSNPKNPMTRREAALGLQSARADYQRGVEYVRDSSRRQWLLGRASGKAAIVHDAAPTSRTRYRAGSFETKAYAAQNPGARNNVFAFNNPKGTYEVIVGNIGFVYRGPSKYEAERIYKEYVRQSKAGYGRADGEAVTMFSGGEIVKQYEGNLPLENPRGGDSSVEKAARAVGLFVATWSPGDGVTRYRFFTKPAPGSTQYADYHQGDGIYTALGRKEALQFIQSYGMGRSARKNPLTKGEARKVLADARGSQHMGESSTGTSRAYWIGHASGQRDVERKFGPYGFMVGPSQVCENPIVRGDKLPHNLQQEVLRRFIYRWTSDNDRRAEVYGFCPYCKTPGGKPSLNLVACRQIHPTIDLQTDREWLRTHAFHVTKDGRLSQKHNHAEPGYMADDEGGPVRNNPLLQTVLMANPPMTLKQWAAKQRVRVTRYGPGIYYVQDSRLLVDRSQAWRLADFYVSSVAGGSIWFAKRSRENPYVVVDRESGRVSSVERGLDMMGARSRAVEWAEYTTADGRPQEVHRVDRGATRMRVGDKWQRPIQNPKKPVYLIEGNKLPYGSVGKRRLPGWPTFRSTSLEDARAEAERIFQQTGIVVAIIKENPLTRREAAQVLRRARYDVRLGSAFRPGHTRSERAGQAHARAQVVRAHGPKSAGRAAMKIADRAQQIAGTVISNPGIRFPKPGTKLTVAQAMRLAQQIGDRELIRQCQEAARLQKKANRGSRCVIWKTLPIGSPNRIDMVTAFAHYGDSPETMYRPPKGSKKGTHMYRHKWGEGTGKQKSVPILAAPGGKALITLMGPGQKTGDWMRG